MEVVQIKKQKTLADILRDLPIGTWAEIKNRNYKSQTVRHTITRLRKENFSFEITEKGCIDFIKVKRIR